MKFHTHFTILFVALMAINVTEAFSSFYGPKMPFASFSEPKIDGEGIFNFMEKLRKCLENEITLMKPCFRRPKPQRRPFEFQYNYARMYWTLVVFEILSIFLNTSWNSELRFEISTILLNNNWNSKSYQFHWTLAKISTLISDFKSYWTKCAFEINWSANHVCLNIILNEPMGWKSLVTFNSIEQHLTFRYIRNRKSCQWF